MTTQTAPNPETAPDSARDSNRLAQRVAVAMAPVPPLATLISGMPGLPVLGLALVLGIMGYLSGRLDARRQALLLAAVLIGHCMAFTAALATHPWQIDTHMLFFAVLAVIATMGSVSAVLLAVVLTALHHVALSLLLPVLVYPVSTWLDAVARSLLHAVIVLFEAGILILSIRRLNRNTAQIQTARSQLSDALGESELARQNAEEGQKRILALSLQTVDVSREVAAAVEEVSSVAEAASEQAGRACSVADQVAEDARQSEVAVGKMMEAMTELQSSTQAIGQIVTMIDEIARRTDLLALNAAVEAARAGDAGRGFAVVAQEVRKLAQRSGEASLQIRGLVQSARGHMADSQQIVGQTNDMQRNVSAAADGLRAMMEQISVGAAEQVIGLSQISKAIGRIERMIDGLQAPEPGTAPDKPPAPKALPHAAPRPAAVTRLRAVS